MTSASHVGAITPTRPDSFSIEQTDPGSPGPSSPETMTGTRAAGDPGHPGVEAVAGLEQRMYWHLRGLIQHALSRPGPRPAFRPDSLVAEAWLELNECTRPAIGHDRFLRLIAGIVRRALIDCAKALKAQHNRKAGARVQCDAGMLSAALAGQDLDPLAVDRCLNQLAELDPDLAGLAELDVFGGIGSADLAWLTGLPEPELRRRLRTARAFVAAQLGIGAACAA